MPFGVDGMNPRVEGGGIVGVLGSNMPPVIEPTPVEDCPPVVLEKLRFGGRGGGGGGAPPAPGGGGGGGIIECSPSLAP
jgi:hypothetical protein